MSNLTLRLEKNSLDAEIGAIATLRLLAGADGGSRPKSKSFDVAIPAGSGARNASIEIEPGLWSVEATLPSGETLAEEVMVAAGESVPVVFRTFVKSPREWLGWQTLVGNIPANLRDGLEILTDNSQHHLIGSAGGIRKQIGRFLKLLDGNSFRGARHFLPRASLIKTEGIGRGEAGWRTILNARSSRGSDIREPLFDTQVRSALFSLTSSDARLLRVCWLDQVFVISLPLPWPRIAETGFAAAQVLVRSNVAKSKIKIGVVVEDGSFGAIIGMMTSSAQPKAANLFRQARSWLLSPDNPLAAAAGGYLLVAGNVLEDDWSFWVDEFFIQQPTMPDAAILRGTMLLRRPRDEYSHAQARQSLIEGFDLGLPYYSAGLSWLLEGLMAFDDGDPEIERRLRLVRQVSRGLDTTQAFTVIKIREPRE